jgi:hypothetical protein
MEISEKNTQIINFGINSEYWKKVVDFSEYEVSNLGNVRSLKKGMIKIINPALNGRGYLSVCLYKDRKGHTKRVHLLIAQSFLNHKNDGTTKISVDHIDNDKTNNKLSNLQLISHRENISKSVKNQTGLTGVKKYNKGYASYITINNKYKHLGFFNTDIEAHDRYKKEIMLISQNKTINQSV